MLDAIVQHNRVLTPLLDRAASLTAETAADGIAAARAVFACSEEAARLLGNAQTYAECLLSVDAQDDPAQELAGRLEALDKRCASATETLAQFINRVPDDVVDAYLAKPATAPSRFAVQHARKRRFAMLPLDQEVLVGNLAKDGIEAWGRLYDQLAGTLACDIEAQGTTRRVGLAQASGLMMAADDGMREAAWRAVNRAWDEHAETCAAAINAIAGWRLEMCQRRSQAGAVHFMDAPLHANRMEAGTLAALMDAAREAVPLARRAARLQARAYGKSRFGPWDLRAPAPATDGDAGAPMPYRHAVDLIAEAYGNVDPSMGEFVSMMAERRWIEGRVAPRKRPGAYCTRFAKSRTPRVYMTFTGAASDIIVLAHELGHAFHAWIMRDLPASQLRYGMGVAETASTFGETVVRDALLARATSPAEELAMVWEEASALTSFVLNIPTRFEFERGFYEARAARPLRPAELKDRMSAAWEQWYGDSLAEPDPLFWASKLHFYITGLSFYNFPYLFGYLFSLGVYARRQTLGDEFFPRYVALLRDTGRMTAEELAARHLEVDIGQPDFWRQPLAMLESRVDRFERLVEAQEGRGP